MMHRDTLGRTGVTGVISVESFGAKGHLRYHPHHYPPVPAGSVEKLECEVDLETPSSPNETGAERGSLSSVRPPAQL